MANPADAGKAKVAREPLSQGLVMELEYLALPGRRFMNEALTKVLKDKDIVLTPVLYSRFAVQPGLTKGLEDLLAAVGKKKLSVGKLAEEIMEQFLRSVQKSSVHLDPEIEALLADAAKANVQIGAISFLPADVARELLEKFGLKDTLTLQVMAAQPRGRSLTEGWLKLLQAMKLPAYRCVALCTDAVAYKAALIAGLRCVVVPDDSTAYQDFSGADLVMANAKELAIKDMLALLSPCAFR